MNITVHHQKERILSGGKVTFIGEDGKPYADDNLLIVADGLGGRGGYPHTKINPDILDEEKFYDLVFKPIFSSEDENYKNFVLQSFSELFSLKDVYFTSTSAMRTSGYFASRLVTAIVLYAFKFDEKFNKDEIFKNISECPPEKLDELTSSYGDYLAQIIKNNLYSISNNIGLELESKTKGSYLLPTTLVSTIIDEHEDYVDALYFWAGDSRGYVWDKDGLAQITDDHEKDETMTNLITLTKPFKIETKYIRIKKPCLLFNGTDGCYKCPVFASPFDLEYVFLQSIASSPDVNKMAEYLGQQFKEIGTHDDSNTIALSSFGYNDFASLLQDVNARLDYINQEYISKLPEILERDYVEELNVVDERIEGAIFKLKDELVKDDKVVAFSKEQMIKCKYAPYTSEVGVLNDKIAGLDAIDDEQKKKISDCIKYYWIRYPRLKQLSNVGDKFSFFHNPYTICKNFENDLDTQRSMFESKYKKILEEYKNLAESTATTLDSIINFNKLSPEENELLKKDLEKLNDHLYSLRFLPDGKTKEYKMFRDTEGKIEKLNDKYVEEDKQTINQMIEQILSGERKVPAVLPLECRTQIEDGMAIIKQNAVLRGKITADIEVLPDKYFEKFWAEKANDVIELIYNDHKELLPEKLLTSSNGDINKLNEEKRLLEAELTMRNEIYAHYELNYKRFFTESKLCS